MKQIYPRIKESNLSIISSNIATLHEAGISFLTIMDLLIELPLTTSYKESIINIKFFIEKGRSLEDALKENKGIYPEFFIGMVSIGEKSGRLTEVLKGLDEYYTKIGFIKNNIINSISYPIMIFISIIFVFIFMIFFIIPNFYEFYLSSGTEAPAICKNIYMFVNYIKANPFSGSLYIICWGVILPIIAINIFFKKYIKKAFYEIRVVKEYNEYLFISILTIIIKSGVNLSLGLEYCSNSFKNGELKDKFQEVNNSILKGKSISETLNDIEWISSYTRAMVKIGEEGGGMEEKLISLSLYLERKTLNVVNRYLKFIEPGMIIFMATIVVIFILIFVMPLFNSLIGGVN